MRKTAKKASKKVRKNARSHGVKAKLTTLAKAAHVAKKSKKRTIVESAPPMIDVQIPNVFDVAGKAIAAAAQRLKMIPKFYRNPSVQRQTFRHQSR